MHNRPTRFTRGPWAIHKGRNGYFCQGDLSGQSVEIVFNCEDIRRADAALIQAAPAMYEALRQIVWKVDATQGYKDMRTDAVMNMARAALEAANPSELRKIP